MFFIAITVLGLFSRADVSQGWPVGNHSKSAENYGIGALDDEVDWSQHPCKRECKDGEEPLTCRYGFTIENYAMMSRACYFCPYNVSDCFRPHCIAGDGNPKWVTVANRRLPGPSIEVCKGDRVIVDVSNKLIDKTTSIHWHGLHMRGTPFMDGVSMVSQCPITTGHKFRYDFQADRAGTYWWHGHNGMQQGEGLFGALIVRPPPKDNLVAKFYDKDEHHIMVNEWSDVVGSDLYTLFYQMRNRSSVPNPHSYLINGLGPYLSKEPRTKLMPHAIFRVEKGMRYRFRLISPVSWHCWLRFKVDGHSLLIVSADGADVRPIEVDSIRIDSGERYDFVLEANREVDNYWIRVTGGEDCADSRAHQQAILRYEGADETKPSQPIGFEVGFDSNDRLLNPFNRFSETEGAMCVSCVLESLEPDDETLLTPNPDYQYYLNFDRYYHPQPDYLRKNLYSFQEGMPVSVATMQINHLSYEPAETPLILQSSDIVGPEHMCNITESKCSREYCSCPHVLQLKLNSIVEFVVVDEGIRFRLPIGVKKPSSHPVHLHGYYFRVLAMEWLNDTITVEQVKQYDRAGKIHRKFTGAPLKDTFDVPSSGYAVVRIRADNPGYWFLHCHLETHMQNGMAMVLKVGEDKDFPALPKNFPTCYNAASCTGGMLPWIQITISVFILNAYQRL